MGMVESIGKLVGVGFTAGIVAGTMIFIVNFILSSVMNIFKIPTRGD